MSNILLDNFPIKFCISLILFEFSLSPSKIHWIKIAIVLAKWNKNRAAAAYDKRAESVAQQASIDKNQQYDDDQAAAAMQHQLNSVSNDRLGDLLDLNSEPAVEDLMRQIMSQAKLWEAIQEANREMVIQKTNSASKSRERFPLTFSAQ